MEQEKLRVVVISAKQHFAKNNLKRRYWFCLLFLLVVCALSAHTGKVNKIWLEHNVTQNGVKGINIHLNVEFQGLKGASLKAIAYLECPKNTGVKDLNGSYCTTDGHVSFSRDLIPSYDSSIFEDLVIFAPINEMHFLRGKNTYYFHVGIYYAGIKDFVCFSEHVDFIGTSGDYALENNNGNHGNNIGQGKFPGNVKFYFSNAQRSRAVAAGFWYSQKENNAPFCMIQEGTDLYRYIWEGTSINGYLHFVGYESRVKMNGFIMEGTYYVKNCNRNMLLSHDYKTLILDGDELNVRISGDEWLDIGKRSNSESGYGRNTGGGYNSGSDMNSGSGTFRDSQCKYCNGTGRCSSCKGKGYKFNVYSGHDESCSSCNGSGRCFNCRGTGKQRTF